MGDVEVSIKKVGGHKQSAEPVAAKAAGATAHAAPAPEGAGALKLAPAGGGAPAECEAGHRKEKRVDLLFEGGGIKGLALVGAINALDTWREYANNEAENRDRLPYFLPWSESYVAGTSVGSIIAALLAAGYSPPEIKRIIFGLDLARLADGTWLSKIPLIGRPIDVTLGLLMELGAFKGDWFLQYLRDLLLDRGVCTFRDLWSKRAREGSHKHSHPGKLSSLGRYKAHFVVSDITRGRVLVLPDDIDPDRHGVNPDNLEVAAAVRMSMSFPFFFRPVMLTGRDGVKTYCVDGGLLNNFPIDLFDPMHRREDDEEPGRYMNLGIRINKVRYHSIGFPFKAARALYAIGSTVVQARDMSVAEKDIAQLKYYGAIQIDTSDASVLDFWLPELRKEALYNEGYAATEAAVHDFLAGAGEVHGESRIALQLKQLQMDASREPLKGVLE